MKKLILFLFAFGIISTGISQAVSDRTTVPIAVNLNQVLRLNILQGGNIEFTFNTIGQYESGINSGGGTVGNFTAPLAGAGGFYQTQFTVASSNNWEIHMGAEDATLIGTDNAGTLALDNIGYSLASTGNHKFNAGVGGVAGEVLISSPTGNGANIVPLTQFPGAAALVDYDPASAANEGNAGNISDNAITITWRVGTAEGTMNAVALINQDVPADRYVTNVLFDLQLDQ
jgi:hypothetical protein